MGKWIRRIVMLVVLAVFLFSVISIAMIMHQYKASDQVYENAVEQYVMYTSSSSESERGENGNNQKDSEAVPKVLELAPITVDFESLQEANGDVCGWIYCEDTPINYPVAQGVDNDYYLKHNYDKSYNVSGTIFVDIENSPNFQDSNTLIYGHNMNNGSMFAALENWAEPGFYEDYPVIWLLTPTQDYKIVLFSGYTTSATSDTYTIFEAPCKELNEYLTKSVGQSDFQADVELEEDGHYVLLTTCAYVFDNARYVLHGKLVPVDSAGGIPLR